MKIELLAPSGSGTTFYEAIANGADAVYLGLLQFSARCNCENFTLSNLREYIRYAHFYGKKVYVAVNTLIKENELLEFLETVKQAYLLKADAFIVQDIFLGRYLKENIKDIVVHLSTQAGINNIHGARTAKNFGIDRVILSRETSFSEIKKISEIIETEVFVQGALCSSFSGSCYFSSFIGKNSGNRGKCMQPCRQKYQFSSFTKPLSYALSLSDLNLENHLQQLINSGVKSFKIEGRMRREEYTAVSVKTYRDKLDEIVLGKKNIDSNKNHLNLTKIYNRGDYTSGLMFGQDKNLISSFIQGHKGLKIGKIQEVKGEKCFVLSEHKSNKGDGFKMLRNNLEVGSAFVEVENNSSSGFFAKCKGSLKIGDEAYITTDSKLSNEILGKKIFKNISVEAIIKKDEKIILKGSCEEVYCVVESDFIPQTSQNKPLTKNEVGDNLNKCLDYNFKITELEIILDEGLFVVKSQFNKLRRDFYDKLKENIIEYFEKNLNVLTELNFARLDIENNESSLNAVITPQLDLEFDEKIDILIYKPNDYKNLLIPQIKNKKIFLYIPSYLNEEDFELIKNIDETKTVYSGIYSEGLAGFELAKLLKKELFLGHNCNISNSISSKYLENAYYSISKEISMDEMPKLLNKKSFVFVSGNIKVMDLVYCPFNKQCGTCEAKDNMLLKDFNDRDFKINRLKLSTCRFEVYFDRDLVFETDKNINRLYDFSVFDETELSELVKDLKNIKNVIKRTTEGHLRLGIN